MKRLIMNMAVLISLASIALGQTANPNLGEYKGELSALFPARVGTYKNSFGRKDLPPDSPKPPNYADAYLVYYESDTPKMRLFLEAYKFASIEEAKQGLEAVERDYMSIMRDDGTPRLRLDEDVKREEESVLEKRLVVHTRNDPNFKVKEELRSVLWTNGSVMFNLYCPCVADTNEGAVMIEKNVLDFEKEFLYRSPVIYTGRIISAGVLNGRAISLPDPAYPPIARAANASGTVTVEVTVDENGKVISAKAISGHPLLQQAAVNAAYQAKFSPTLLSGRPVRVKGTLIYKFPPNE